jgi:hypothetical protein
LIAFYVSEHAKNLDYRGGPHAHGEPVIRWPLLRTLTNRWLRSVRIDNRAAQLVEFAVSLPLLMVFVVGIFDFSNAFTLKEIYQSGARRSSGSG